MQHNPDRVGILKSAAFRQGSAADLALAERVAVIPDVSGQVPAGADVGSRLCIKINSGVAQPRQSRDAQISNASQGSVADLALAERVAVIPLRRDVGSIP